MKEFTIELEEVVCSWLEHIAKITGESIETIIANRIYHQIEVLKDDIVKKFTYNEQNE